MTVSPPDHPFAGLPVYEEGAIEDTGCVIVGIPYVSPYPGYRQHSSFNAPAVVREGSRKYMPLDSYDFDFDGPLLGRTSACKCFDLGNLVRTTESLNEYRRGITGMIKNLLSAGAVPLVIGGDHGTTIPVLEAYLEYPGLCVVQIDAHLDWIDERGGMKYGFSSPMRRAAEHNFIGKIVQIGLRGTGSARTGEVEAAHTSGKVTIIKASEIYHGGTESLLAGIPETPYYYLTIDADGLDPAIAPGVAYPTPGGVTYYQLFSIMKHLGSLGKLVGMDFVEIVPELDVNNLTSIFAARQILNMMGLLSRS